MKVQLSKQIMVDGELVDSLDLKEPTFKHLIEMTKQVPEVNPQNTKEIIWRPRSEAEQTLALIASLAGITEREAGAISLKDTSAVMEVVGPFLFFQETE